LRTFLCIGFQRLIVFLHRLNRGELVGRYVLPHGVANANSNGNEEECGKRNPDVAHHQAGHSEALAGQAANAPLYVGQCEVPEDDRGNRRRREEEQRTANYARQSLVAVLRRHAPAWLRREKLGQRLRDPAIGADGYKISEIPPAVGALLQGRTSGVTLSLRASRAENLKEKCIFVYHPIRPARSPLRRPSPCA
jgi:hypothetical protein